MVELKIKEYLSKYSEYFSHPDYGMHFHFYYSSFPTEHYHDHWEFFIVLQDEICHKLVDNIEILKRNSFYLMRPNKDSHAFICPNGEKKSCQLNISFTDKVFQDLCMAIFPSLYDKICNLKKPPSGNLSNELRESILSRIHLLQTFNSNDVEHYQVIFKTIILDAIELIYKNLIHADSSYPDWLNDLILKMKSPENISMKVENVCKLTNYSHTHLLRLFKQHTQKTLVEYFKEVKVSYASNLLATTDKSILDISLDLGYDSVSHFIKAFKKYFGKTPLEYRKQ